MQTAPKLDPERDWLTPSVRNSGTHFIRRCTGGPNWKESNYFKLGPSWKGFHGGQITQHFYNVYCDFFRTASKYLKTVVPLRHPALVAMSWKKRSQTGMVFEWMNMEGVTRDRDVFFFPLETKPYDELEDYLGREVYRDDSVVNAIDDYDHSMQAAKEYLKDEWWSIQKLMEEDRIASQYYGGNY